MTIAGFLESYVLGPSGFWTMAPLRYAAKFAIWQPWQVHLWVLTLAYACFMVPMILVDTGLLEVMVGQGREEGVGRALYSLYWWMFAMNFAIYVLFIEDFRNIYRYCFITSFKRVKHLVTG